MSIVLYKEYFFVKKERLVETKRDLNSEDLLILDTDPRSAIISHRHMRYSSYSRILSSDEIIKYLRFSNIGEKEFLCKAKRLGKFRFSKNRNLGYKMIFICILLIFEVLLVPYLKKDPFIGSLELVGATLMFFFSYSLIEPESHGLMLQSYDEEAETEARKVSFILSSMGLALFLISFFIVR